MKIILIGLTIGTIIGLVAAYIAYLQSLPRMRAWGFARAKTKEEKQLVQEYNEKKYFPAVEELAVSSKAYLIPGLVGLLAVIVGIYFGKNVGDQVKTLIGCIAGAFAVVLIPGFVVFAFLADKKIRAASEIEKRNLL